MAACGEDDLRLAEAALYELALVLRRVPVDEHTRQLHLSVLRLKRDVQRWHARIPGGAERSAVLSELRSLKGEAALFDKDAALVRRAGEGQEEGTT